MTALWITTFALAAEPAAASPDAFNWGFIAAAAGVVAVLNALFFWATKWLLDRFHEQINQRFALLDVANQKRLEGVQDLERKLLELRAELPENYVRREDWIRFSAVIDAKLDAVHEAIKHLTERLYERRTERTREGAA